MTSTLPESLVQQFAQVVLSLPPSFNEIELINALQTHAPEQFVKPDMFDSLTLFRHHFLIMHLSYQVQASELITPYFLEITQIGFNKLNTCDNNNQQAIKATDPMREYYLDLENLEKESKQSIDALLNNFWREFERYINKDDAYEVLGLASDATPSEAKAQYRRLAAKHHPDKGGDAKRFNEIRLAWESISG